MNARKARQILSNLRCVHYFDRSKIVAVVDGLCAKVEGNRAWYSLRQRPTFSVATVLRLYDEGLTFKEIAQKLGVSLGRVRERVYRHHPLHQWWRVYRMVGKGARDYTDEQRRLFAVVCEWDKTRPPYHGKGYGGSVLHWWATKQIWRDWATKQIWRDESLGLRRDE